MLLREYEELDATTHIIKDLGKDSLALLFDSYK